VPPVCTQFVPEHTGVVVEAALEVPLQLELPPHEL